MDNRTEQQKAGRGHGRIDVVDFIEDAKTGMRVTALMAKHSLSRSSVIWRLKRLGFDTAKPNECIGRGGYAMYYMPRHPRAQSNGQVLRCIVLWEMYYGESFPDGKEPHHKDLDKLNDDPENIEPLTHSEHSKLHYALKHRQGDLRLSKGGKS